MQRSVLSALCNPADYAAPPPPALTLPESPPTGPLEPWLRKAVARAFANSADLSLSAGLDSSLLLALAVAEGFSPVCWTLVRNDDVEGTEPQEAASFATSVGSGCYGINLLDSELPEYFADAVRAAGVPVYNAAGVRWFLYHRRIAKGGATKLVSGVGADEIFFGQPSQFQNLKFLAARVPECELARQWLKPSLRRHVQVALPPARGLAASQTLRLDTEFSGSTLPVRANAAIAARLEYRLPYMDAFVRGWAAAQPPDSLAAQGGKSALRELGRKFLPAAVVDRPKRPGMAGLLRPDEVHQSWLGTLRSLLAPHRLEPLRVLDERAVLAALSRYATAPDEALDRALLKLASLVVLTESEQWPASF